MNIIKYLLCKNSGMSNGESFLRASTNMPISGGAVRVIEKTVPFTDIITVTDALARPAVDLQSEITATQNLNGYEYPWVGGAGTNKVDNKSFTHGLPSTSIGASQSTITASTRYAYYGFNINGGNYTVSAVSNDLDHYNAVLIYGYKNGVLTVYTFSYITDMADGHVTVDMGDCDYMRVCIGARLSSIEVPTDLTNYGTLKAEEGSTATPWENICPISGRTEVNVTRTGKNLLSSQTVTKAGSTYYVGGGASDFPFFLKAGTYTMSNSGTAAYCYWRLQGTSLNNIIHDANVRQGTFTVAEDGFYRFWFYSTVADASFTELQIELGSTATAYEPYEGDTFNTELGRTVYGGSLDLTTGELTITHAYEDLYSRDWLYSPSHNVFTRDLVNKKNGATNFITTNYRTVNKDVDELLNGEITGTWLSNKSITIKDERATTVADFVALLADAKICYELATPQTISLTPTEVMMLENNNTIWADSGRVQLTYYAPEE